MALTDQPYLPLYVNDLLTDEKLAECSAEAHGVYLRLLCILHKQEKYGLLCLKQKYKQPESKDVSKFSEFAYMLARQMPFEQKQISACLEELVREDVIQMQGDTICQKRMFKDGELSLIRAISGKMGGSNVTKQYGKSGYLYIMSDFGTLIKIGISTNPKNRLYRLRCDMGIKNLTIIDTVLVGDMGAAEDFAHDFFGEKMNGEWVTGRHDDVVKEFALLKAKLQANTVNEIEINTKEDSSIGKDEGSKELESNYRKGEIGIVDDFDEQPDIDETALSPKMISVFKKYFPKYEIDLTYDYGNARQIAYKIARRNGWTKASVVNGKMPDCLSQWEEIVKFIKSNSHFKKLSLNGLNQQWSGLIQTLTNSDDETENNSRNSGKGKGVKNPEHQQGKYFDFDD